MTKWGKTFIDYALYASYLAARRAKSDLSHNEPDRPSGNPSISKTVYPDGRTVHHVKTNK